MCARKVFAEIRLESKQFEIGFGKSILFRTESSKHRESRLSSLIHNGVTPGSESKRGRFNWEMLKTQPGRTRFSARVPSFFPRPHIPLALSSHRKTPAVLRNLGNRYGHRTEIPPNKDIILRDKIYHDRCSHAYHHLYERLPPRLIRKQIECRASQLGAQFHDLFWKKKDTSHAIYGLVKSLGLCWLVLTMHRRCINYDC